MKTAILSLLVGMVLSSSAFAVGGTTLPCGKKVTASMEKAKNPKRFDSMLPGGQVQVRVSSGAAATR